MDHTYLAGVWGLHENGIARHVHLSARGTPAMAAASIGVQEVMSCGKQEALVFGLGLVTGTGTTL